jgi:hypothetical protein
MSLSDLASLGSFVSGVAVLVTLFFLLLQMRQSNRNQKSLMQQGRSARAAATNIATAHPDIARILNLGLNGDEALNDTELVSFYQVMAAMFINFEDSFRQHRAGTLDDESLESDRGAVLNWAAVLPGFRAVWEIEKGGFATDFRMHMDEVIRSVKLGARPDLTEVWKAKVREQRAMMTGSKS